jgi:PAS domain S-box-containing protein
VHLAGLPRVDYHIHVHGLFIHGLFLRPGMMRGGPRSDRRGREGAVPGETGCWTAVGARPPGPNPVQGLRCAERDEEGGVTTGPREHPAADLAARIAAAQAVLDAILSATDDGFYVLDRHRRIVYVNAAGARLVGRAPAELIGQSWRRLGLARGAAARLWRQAQGVFATGTPAQDEIALGGSGPERRFACTLGPLRAPDGAVEAVVVTARDVTAIRATAAERAHLLDREQALARIARSLIQEVELDRVAGVVLDQCCRVLGMDAAVIWLVDAAQQAAVLLAWAGLDRADLTPLQRLPLDPSAPGAEVLRRGQPRAVDERSEEPAAAAWSAPAGLRSFLLVPLSARGRPVGILGVGTRRRHRFSPAEVSFHQTVADLCGVAIENARLYEQARLALRLREEFMAAAAHELKTPVTVIKGRLQLLLRTGSLSPPLRDGLTVVLNHVDRIARLIDDLLAALRIRPGQVTLQRSRIDLGELVRQQIGRIAPTAPDHPIRVDVTGRLVVTADPELIGEVVAHLLENALRYSPPGGTVTVAARPGAGEAIVAVSDAGIGIPPERQPHVFEPFYEPVPPGMPGYVGTVSLGLFLSKQIIEAHGGRIWLESTPGRGATFFFSLPLAAPTGPER